MPHPHGHGGCWRDLGRHQQKSTAQNCAGSTRSTKHDAQVVCSICLAVTVKEDSPQSSRRKVEHGQLRGGPSFECVGTRAACSTRSGRAFGFDGGAEVSQRHAEVVIDAERVGEAAGVAVQAELFQGRSFVAVQESDDDPGVERI